MKVIFYCEFVDSEHKKHYAVHTFNNTTRLTASISDLKFDKNKCIFSQKNHN